MSDEVGEPSWRDTLTKLEHIEAKISLNLSGVDLRERRELKLAIDRLTGFIMKGVVAEDVAAIGRDKQAWIDEQMKRLSLAWPPEGQPDPKGRPPIMRRIK